MTLLEQRRIEAGVLAPVIMAFQEEVGEERANEIVRGVISALAEERGREIASETGGSPIDQIHACFEKFGSGGSLELTVINRSAEEYKFNVTRCEFAELYREMGIPELGFLLSCSRDFALAKGLSQHLELTRTQTIMEGGDHCDFCFRTRSCARTQP